MRNIKVVLDFTKLSIPEKIAFYLNVLACLTNNTSFSNPDISLEEAKAALNDLEAALLASHDGAHSTTATLHEKVKIADKAFHILANYVDRVADGNTALILSSGFHAAQPIQVHQKAEFSVVDGAHSGSVKYIIKKIPRTGAYILQYRTVDASGVVGEWITAGHSTSATFELSGLTAGATYEFRFAAVTPDGTTDFCAPVTKIVI